MQSPLDDGVVILSSPQLLWIDVLVLGLFGRRVFLIVEVEILLAGLATTSLEYLVHPLVLCGLVLHKKVVVFLQPELWAIS